MSLESSRDLVREYTRQLTAAKKEYESKIAEELIAYERRGTESYNFYGSELEADEPVSGIPSGYFSRNSLHSFFGLGGYTAERLQSEADAFRADPANAGRFVICFDAFGQGRENMRTLYGLTDEGGLIFISASGGGFDVKILRDILHEFGLSQIADPEEDYQPRLLLRKNSSIAQELPSFKDIAAREPEFIKSILRIAK